MYCRQRIITIIVVIVVDSAVGVAAAVATATGVAVAVVGIIIITTAAVVVTTTGTVVVTVVNTTRINNWTSAMVLMVSVICVTYRNRMSNHGDKVVIAIQCWIVAIIDGRVTWKNWKKKMKKKVVEKKKKGEIGVSDSCDHNEQSQEMTLNGIMDTQEEQNKEKSTTKEKSSHWSE